MSRLFFGAVALCSAVIVSAQPAVPNLRLRGTIEQVDATSMVLKERDGRTMTLSFVDTLSVSEALPIDPASIQSGTFVGTAAVAAPDGSMAALEVLVFPEAMRGTGEGHSNWDLQPGSTMTNATVAAVAPGATGRRMTLRYKDGEKTIVVPDGVPIVTLKPADRSLLVVGAKVLVTAQNRDGKLVALRITAGRDDFTPPM